MIALLNNKTRRYPSAPQVIVKSRCPIKPYRIIMLDTSLSMTQKKRKIMALASAVTLITTGSPYTAVITFQSSADVLKPFHQDEHPYFLIKKILNLKPKGFTNITSAIIKVKGQLAKIRYPRSEIILISDGVFTEGENPLQQIGGIVNLNVIDVGTTDAGHKMCMDLANKTRGKHYRLSSLDEIPSTIHRLIKGI